MNQLINDEAVYRTALATPGLLNIYTRTFEDYLLLDIVRKLNSFKTCWALQPPWPTLIPKIFSFSKYIEILGTLKRQ